MEIEQLPTNEQWSTEDWGFCFVETHDQSETVTKGPRTKLVPEHIDFIPVALADIAEQISFVTAIDSMTGRTVLTARFVLHDSDIGHAGVIAIRGVDSWEKDSGVFWYVGSNEESVKNALVVEQG